MFEMIHLLVEMDKCNELFNESLHETRKKLKRREKINEERAKTLTYWQNVRKKRNAGITLNEK